MANIRKHGVDLAIAEDFDFTTALIVEDANPSYREQREVALGWIGERLFVYVYTLRGEEDHAISLRPANRRSGVAMPNKSDPLTPDELQTLKERRARARERAIAQLHDDADNPPLSDAQLAQLRPAHEVRPELVAARLKREREHPPSVARELISIQLDPDIIERLRSTGEGWQGCINGLLREALGLTQAADKASLLDGRHQGRNADISHRGGNTPVGTLREHYGAGFASGVEDTDTLAHVLATLDESSLNTLIQSVHNHDIDPELGEWVSQELDRLRPPGATPSPACGRRWHAKHDG